MAAAQGPSQLNPPNPGSTKLDVEGGLEAKGDPSKTKNESWQFVELQPIREDQVQNAMKFLSHPKVKGSPIIHRRSFLERKGLTREEIEEAFRRVPDSPSNESSNSAVSTEGRHSLPQGLPQTQSTVYQSQAVLPAQQQPMTQQIVGGVPSPMVRARTQPHWSQVVLGVGILATAGAGAGVLFQRVFIPKLKAWVRGVVSEEGVEQEKQKKPSHVEDVVTAATIAANAAATTTAEVVDASRELMKSHSGELQNLTGILKSLESQTQDLKSVLTSMITTSPNLDKSRQEFPVANGHLEEPSGADYHKAQPNSNWRTLSSIEQVQQREGIQTNPKEVNDKPLNPNQPLSSSILQLRSKSWETAQIHTRNKLANIQTSDVNVGSTHASHLSARSAPASEGWNQGNTAIVFQGKPASFADPVSGNEAFNDELWWRRKKAEPKVFTLPDQLVESRARITEIESALGDGDPGGADSSSPSRSGGHGGNELISSSFNAMVGRQGWVPHPVPQTFMPGAAAAIRYHKAVTKGDTKSSSILEEKAPSVHSFTGYDFPQVAPFMENVASSLSATQSVQAHKNNGQERVPPEYTNTEKPSYKDVLKEEPGVQ